MDRPDLHSTDRLKEGGVEKGCGRHPDLRGQQDNHLHNLEGSLWDTAESG